MMLFDLIERCDEGPALYAEPDFRFLNRSARLAVGRIRDTLEAWFSRYPAIGQDELRRRFRSGDDSQHRSAFFELFLHELLSRLGCRVELHPTPPEATRKRPDFLVESSQDHKFYLEAVLATDESTAEKAERARMNAVYDALNRLRSPGFFIGMRVRGAPATPPPARRMRAFLAERLSALDPDEIESLVRSAGYRALPHWLYEHEGWQIEFFPIPKSPATRGKAGVRPIATKITGGFVNPRDAVRDAIVWKAGRYGDLELPYVIAVNVLGAFAERMDILEALFGKEQITVRYTESGPSEPQLTREPDGAWTSKSGPRNTRVSAVLIAVGLMPWSVPTAPICLYHHPQPRRPYACELTRLNQALAENGYIRWQDGESLGVIFDLPSEWPDA